jgi:hypothetical protein
MHVSSALDAIKKRGTFKTSKTTRLIYVEQFEVVKEAKAIMNLSQSPLAKARNPPRRGLTKLPRRLLGRTAPRKRRLLRRPSYRPQKKRLLLV